METSKAMQVMEGLIREARERKCLLQPEGYPDLFFTPGELEVANTQGKFVWGNRGMWVFKQPKVILERAQEKLHEAQRYHSLARETVVKLAEEVGELEGREEWDNF